MAVEAALPASEAVDVEFPELLATFLLCLKSCSMSWSCCAVRPLLENLILVQSPVPPSTEDFEMR